MNNDQSILCRFTEKCLSHMITSKFAYFSGGSGSGVIQWQNAADLEILCPVPPDQKSRRAQRWMEKIKEDAKRFAAKGDVVTGPGEYSIQ